MATERQRLLELALESLEAKKKEAEVEIAILKREVARSKARSGGQALGLESLVATQPARARFSKEERLRRSRRMKAFWEKWRKQRAAGPS